jgi:ribosome-binding protein aMBF1 (putative translation factor)
VGALSPEAVAAQFGRNLAEARGWEGLSQTQLAQRIAKRQSDVARWELGERCPRLDYVVRLADAVSVQVRDLLYGIE